jgi:hypothetical protein
MQVEHDGDSSIAVVAAGQRSDGVVDLPRVAGPGGGDADSRALEARAL